MSKKFIYTEFNLEKSKLIQLSDNGFQIILKFIEKTDLKKTLIVRSIFIDLGENIFDIEVRSSIYDNINSKNAIFNFKLGILEEEKANPFLLMKKVFSKVQTTNLNRTSSNYNQLLLDTFSLKLWKRNNSTKLGLKKDDTSSSASTTTSSQACTSCKSTTELPSNLSGTYGTEDECDCFSISRFANNNGTTTIYGNITLSGQSTAYYNYGTTTIYGNITLSGPGNAYYNYGTTTIYGNITLSGQSSVYYNGNITLSGQGIAGTTTIYGNIIKKGPGSAYYNERGTLIINGINVPPQSNPSNASLPPSNGVESSNQLGGGVGITGF